MEEKAPVKDFRKPFPVSRNTAVSKIGNDVISLLWGSDVIATLIIKKISSLFYKAVVVIVQIFAYGNVVYVQTWEVMSLKKNPRAT